MALPNPIVEGNVLQIPAIQSIDYTTGGSTGWRIARDGTADFNDLNLRGNVGAAQVSADLGIFADIELPNYDSLDTTLDNITSDTTGQLVGWWDQTDANLVGLAAEIKTIGLDFLALPDRIYRIDCYARLTASANTASGQMLLRGIANTDGTFPVAPTIANTAVMLQVTYNGAGTGNAVTPFGVAVLDTTGWGHNTWVRLILTLSASTGTFSQASGTAGLGTPTLIRTVRYAPAARMVVMDAGPSASLNISGQGYNTTDVVPTSGGSTPPTVKSYSKTFNATWSRTYDGNNATTWDDTPYCYQGYYSSTRGNTKSLIGFDYAAIAAALAGATVTGCKLTIKSAHAYYNSGYTLWWGTHNYTAKPASWNGANVNQNRNFITNFAAGKTATINLGTAIGNEFKAQTSRGISSGPGPTTSLIYYGFAYGATSSGRPYLTFTYTK